MLPLGVSPALVSMPTLTVSVCIVIVSGSVVDSELVAPLKLFIAVPEDELFPTASEDAHAAAESDDDGDWSVQGTMGKGNESEEFELGSHCTIGWQLEDEDDDSDTIIFDSETIVFPEDSEDG